MKNLQTLHQSVLLIPVSNAHISIQGSWYAECSNVSNKGKGLDYDIFFLNFIEL